MNLLRQHEVMAKEVSPRWSQRVNAIDAELVHLAVACDVSLSDPSTVERIIKNDDSVCGRKNEVGFRKLRGVIVVTYVFLGESIERIGPVETRRIVSTLAEHIYIFKRARTPRVGQARLTDHGYTRLGSTAEPVSGGKSV